MTENKKLVWTLPWVVKLLLTMLVGGALSVGTYLLFTDVFPIGAADSIFFMVFWQVSVGTSLYRFERNAWRRSIIKGLVLGLVGSAVFTTAGFLSHVDHVKSPLNQRHARFRKRLSVSSSNDPTPR